MYESEIAESESDSPAGTIAGLLVVLAWKGILALIMFAIYRLPYSTSGSKVMWWCLQHDVRLDWPTPETK